MEDEQSIRTPRENREDKGNTLMPLFIGGQGRQPKTNTYPTPICRFSLRKILKKSVRASSQGR